VKFPAGFSALKNQSSFDFDIKKAKKVGADFRNDLRHFLVRNSINIVFLFIKTLRNFIYDTKNHQGRRERLRKEVLSLGFCNRPE